MNTAHRGKLTLLAYACTSVIAFCQATNGLPTFVLQGPHLRSAILQTNPPGLILHALSNAPPSAANLYKPGLYKTVPYSCLVLVPGGALDKGTLLVPPQAPEMPLVQPKLEFVPWPSEKK